MPAAQMRNEPADDLRDFAGMLAIVLAKILEVGRDSLGDRGAARGHFAPTVRSAIHCRTVPLR